MSRIHKSVDFDVPATTLWRALTEKELLATWLMPNDFEPRVGHRFTMTTDPAPFFDGTVHLEVLEITAPHRMRWSWRGGPIDTVVTFTITPLSADSCRFDFLQEGFNGATAQFARFFLNLGWRKTGNGLLRTVVRTLHATSTSTSAS